MSDYIRYKVKLSGKKSSIEELFNRITSKRYIKDWNSNDENAKLLYINWFDFDKILPNHKENWHNRIKRYNENNLQFDSKYDCQDIIEQFGKLCIELSVKAYIVHASEWCGRDCGSYTIEDAVVHTKLKDDSKEALSFYNFVFERPNRKHNTGKKNK